MFQEEKNGRDRMSYVPIHGITHRPRLLGSHTATYFIFSALSASLAPYRMSSRKTQADNEVGGHISSLTAKTIRRRSRLLQTAANLHSFRRQRPSSPYLAQLRPSTHTDTISRQGKEDEEEKRPRKNDKGRRQLDSWHCRVVGS